MNAGIYKCVIIDDEPIAHYVLNNYIDKNPDLICSAQCYNAIEALNFLRNNPVDLLFLDIDMPEINGLEFLKLSNTPSKTILTTAYSEHALESYDYGVIDYLLKPISPVRFLKAVERFLSFKRVPKVEEPQTLTIKVDGRNHEIALDHIIYIQSYGNYVKIHTKSKVYLASMSTQQILSYIPSSKFMRIQKSYIVSLDKITGFSNSCISINDEKLPVGITFKRELQEKLNNIL